MAYLNDVKQKLRAFPVLMGLTLLFITLYFELPKLATVVLAMVSAVLMTQSTRLQKMFSQELINTAHLHASGSAVKIDKDGKEVDRRDF